MILLSVFPWFYSWFLLVVIPSSRFAHQGELSWVGREIPRNFHHGATVSPTVLSPQPIKNVLHLPSKWIIAALAIIRFWGRCFVKH